MKTIKVHDGTITMGNTDFKCPTCNKDFQDTEGKYLDECNDSPVFCTDIPCECGVVFTLAHDYKGNPVTFISEDPIIEVQLLNNKIMDKPNCMNCMHAGPIVAGSSHHISCEVMGHDHESKIMLSRDPNAITLENGTPIFKLNPHGVVNNWCNFPFNYDPIWVDSCLLFAEKDTSENSESKGKKEVTASIKTIIEKLNELHKLNPNYDGYRIAKLHLQMALTNLTSPSKF